LIQQKRLAKILKLKAAIEVKESQVIKNKCLFFAQTVLFIVFLFVLGTTFSDQEWFGDDEDVAFAERLWDEMLKVDLVGDNAFPHKPYFGTHPHGAILESIIFDIIVDNREATIVVKRSYRGDSATLDSVTKNRGAYLDDYTIMFKREAGYDEEHQNWFWAKYNPDGSIDTTPNGVKLAGRIAKGKPKGCIACHKKAKGDDYLFIN